jgi:hypothetical protein
MAGFASTVSRLRLSKGRTPPTPSRCPKSNSGVSRTPHPSRRRLAANRAAIAACRQRVELQRRGLLRLRAEPRRARAVRWQPTHWESARSVSATAHRSSDLQRLRVPVPSDDLIVGQIRGASGGLQGARAKERTPAHASKAACTSQLPASLSLKRTAAFGSPLPVRRASEVGTNLRGWQGQF